MKIKEILEIPDIYHLIKYNKNIWTIALIQTKFDLFCPGFRLSSKSVTA